MNREFSSGKLGWMLTLAGIVLICFGIGMGLILGPYQKYFLPALSVAVLILAIGVFEIAFSLIRHHFIYHWGSLFSRGLVDLAISGYLLWRPGTDLLLWFLVASFWMFFRLIIAIGSFLDTYNSGGTSA